MNDKEIYFDNNATTTALPEVKEEALRTMREEFGNPSSAHRAGARGRLTLENARRRLASLLGVPPDKITFTSSGTESNNMAFYSACGGRLRTSGAKDVKIITTTVEHSSIQKMCSYLSLNGVQVKTIGVDSKGRLDIESLEKEINENTDLVSVGWVNNETGIVQPIDEIGCICRSRGVVLHTDAAQAVGKIDMNVQDAPIDFLSLTGHKFHSPQGVGAIYSKERFLLTPIMFGGFQEEGFRPGTENVPGVAGMGKAAEIRNNRLAEFISLMKSLRDRFEAMVLDSIPGAKVNGDVKRRVCNTTNLSFSGVDGKKLVAELDQAGVRCSQSSACTNFETAPSYVLCAMGLSKEEAYSSVRFSFSVENTTEEIDKAVDLIKIIHPKVSL